MRCINTVLLCPHVCPAKREASIDFNPSCNAENDSSLKPRASVHHHPLSSDRTCGLSKVRCQELVHPELSIANCIKLLHFWREKFKKNIRLATARLPQSCPPGNDPTGVLPGPAFLVTTEPRHSVWHRLQGQLRLGQPNMFLWRVMSTLD